MEALSPEYFLEYFLDKTMEIGFSNLFLQYFPNISILWKRSNFCSERKVKKEEEAETGENNINYEEEEVWK